MQGKGRKWGYIGSQKFFGNILQANEVLFGKCRDKEL